MEAYPALGALFALISAMIWGGADFSGGISTRRITQFQTLALSAFSGMLVLAGLAVLFREPWPAWQDVLWSVAAGVAGAAGIAALYYGLSLGQMALVAPIAAVVGAVAPVVFGLLTRNPATPGQILGFLIALPGIWLVSYGSSATDDRGGKGLALALLAGLAFGGFFILIAQVRQGAIYIPLVVARLAMLGLAGLFLLLRGLPVPPLRDHPLALLAGGLDAGGNIFYLFAVQFTRLDVAAVLSSLYPAVTVILASLVVKEKISPGQWVGIVVCLLAVLLIVY
jgi:drug/metabolite transporter (DMT)-like permease